MIAPKDQQIEALLGERAFKAPNLLCGSGHKIVRFCSNKQCKYDSLCCDEDQCQHCQSLHQLCSFSKLKQLNKAVQERLFLHNKILRKLFRIENQFINKLMATRRLIIEKNKDWGFGGKSLIIDSIYFKNNIKGLKGKDLNELLLQLSQKAGFEIEADQQLESYRKQGDRIVQSLEKMKNNLIQNLGKNKEVELEKKLEKKLYKKLENKLEVEQKIIKENVSKILGNDKQGKQKQAFLMKQLNNPSSLMLIFRASQHNFSASKFHECCDGISDTVTIVRTEFGKTIAAYTPLKWSSVQGHVADDSSRSFLLQLELKQKMTLTKPQKAIYNYRYFGPTFGQGHDLCIPDQCNFYKNNSTDFPNSYNCNGKYTNGNQSKNHLCGHPKGKFGIVDYEVFFVVYK